MRPWSDLRGFLDKVTALNLGRRTQCPTSRINRDKHVISNINF